MGTFNYYNIRKNTGSQDLQFPSKIIETWAVAKRNASSYIFDLSSADQSTWECNLETLSQDQYDREHDLEMHTGTRPEILGPGKATVSPISATNLTICMRDPLQRYISALCMVQYDPEALSVREMTMPPSYNAGGRDLMVQAYNLDQNIGQANGPLGSQCRQLYMWQMFLRTIATTILAPMGRAAMPDYTFNESHLDPCVSIAALVPFVEPGKTISYVDIWKWTDYTTNVLGIPVDHEIVDRWSGRVKEGTVGKPQTLGKVMFSMLKRELPSHFTRQDAERRDPQNWKQTFDNWLEPEIVLYKFFKENPVIAPESDAKQKLMELLIELLQDPYFIVRHPEIDYTFTNTTVISHLPKELQVAVNVAVAKSREWYTNWRVLNFDARA